MTSKNFPDSPPVAVPLDLPMPRCSGKSVGVLVVRSDRMLLIRRKKVPFGWAPPAGHFEDRDVLTFETARRELREETGLTWSSGGLVKQFDPLPCRCSHGTERHEWFVYLAVATGNEADNTNETTGRQWVDSRTLHQLAWRSDAYLRGKISEADWQANPGLEPVWVTMLRELEYI